MSAGIAGDDVDEGEAGFALAEVLVAFAILALVSLAMLRAFAGTTAVVAAVSARETRLLLAQTLIEEARGGGRLVPGRVGGERDGLAFAVTVSEVREAGRPAPEGAPRPMRVAVAVAPGPGAPPDPGAPLLVGLALAVPGRG